MSTANTMRAIAVSAWGKTPALTTVPKPSAQPGSTQIRILASGLPNLVRSQASGTHYSVSGAPLPYTPGIEVIGYTPDNTLVHAQLLSAKPQGGGFAEYVNAPNAAITPIPLPTGTDEAHARRLGIKVAALTNPTMSSHMALTQRVHIASLTDRPFSVLILGATSSSGRIAALTARRLGAKHIIGVARNAEQLEDLKSKGRIDEAIPLHATDVSQTDFSPLNSDPARIAQLYPMIVLDYIWGPTAKALLDALPKSAQQAENLEIRWCHVGTLGADPVVGIEGPLLRSKNVTLSGAGPGSWSLKALAREMPAMVDVIVNSVGDKGWVEEFGITERKLEEVEEAWVNKKERTVFVMQ